MTTDARSLLVPYDGSVNAKRALDYAIEQAQSTGAELHLLNVQPPLSGDVATFVGRGNVRQYHHDEAEKILAPARRKVESAGLPLHCHIGVGQPGPVIADFVDQLKSTQVVMGTRGLGSALGLLLGSVATHVVGHVKVPVTLIK
ncbi:MAG TPA: universal stress protein [Alphaproteobacteria bacterium]|jgi:nucleotide-binding universal stress UspA family protein|nr:universal stress protein [Alphaproteobacteria bacterium]